MMWMSDAACRTKGMDPDWWETHQGLAAHVCRCHCPVRDDCLSWADGRRWHGLIVGGERLDIVTPGKAPERRTPADKRGCPACAPFVAPVRTATGCERCLVRAPRLASGQVRKHRAPNGEWCE